MIGVLQLCVSSCPKKNLSVCTPLVAKAKTLGCQFLCLPEAFDYIGEPGSGLGKKQASILTDDLVKSYCNLAKDNSIWLSLGGLHEKIENKSKIANTHLIVNNNGEIVANYRKIHLFDANVEIPNGYKESNSVEKGNKIVAIDTPIGRIGLAICFDLRFPELFAKLAEMGCDVILVPSAFMPSTGKVHWHTLLKARAIENQVYIVAAAQSGAHNCKRSSFGHSLIVDPWGKVLVDLKDSTNELGITEISIKYLQEIKQRIPMKPKPDLSNFKKEIIKS